MQVQLTSPAKGKMPGDKVTMTDAEGRWHVAQGYARVDDDGDHRLDSSVEASADPTLAANRELPGEPPGTIANDDDEDAWTEKVVARQEFKGKSGRGKRKIVPGKPETQVAALEATLTEQVSEQEEDEELDEDEVRPFDADEQPAPSEVVQTEDPLADEDLTERPEISADDTPVKGGKKS